jgi:hypothetical protein
VHTSLKVSELPARASASNTLPSGVRNNCEQVSRRSDGRRSTGKLRTAAIGGQHDADAGRNEPGCHMRTGERRYAVRRKRPGRGLPQGRTQRLAACEMIRRMARSRRGIARAQQRQLRGQRRRNRRAGGSEHALQRQCIGGDQRYDADRQAAQIHARSIGLGLWTVHYGQICASSNCGQICASLLL